MTSATKLVVVAKLHNDGSLKGRNSIHQCDNLTFLFQPTRVITVIVRAKVRRAIVGRLPFASKAW